MNKVNPFPAPCPLIFLSNLPKIEEVILVANLGKTSLAKEKTRPKLPTISPNFLQRNPPF